MINEQLLLTAVRVGGAVGLGGDEDLTQRIEHEVTLTHSHPSPKQNVEDEASSLDLDELS
jgi:hypothetical protein